MPESCLLSLLHSGENIQAIPESLISVAYEAINDAERAFYKQTIARHFTLWGEGLMQKKCVQTYAQDFSVATALSPAPFTLVVCTANYKYPSALLAALMPALCAHTVPLCFLVEELPKENLVLACASGSAQMPCGTTSHKLPQKARSVLLPHQETVNKTPINQALLCAFELAGIQSIYTATHEGIIVLFEKMIAQCGQGRLLVLDENGALDSMVLATVERMLPAHFLTGTPTYFAQPLHSIPSSFSLTLAIEHENIFLWPQLDMQWFYNRHVEFGVK